MLGAVALLIDTLFVEELTLKTLVSTVKSPVIPNEANVPTEVILVCAAVVRAPTKLVAVNVPTPLRFPPVRVAVPSVTEVKVPAAGVFPPTMPSIGPVNNVDVVDPLTAKTEPLNVKLASPLIVSASTLVNILLLAAFV